MCVCAVHVARLHFVLEAKGAGLQVGSKMKKTSLIVVTRISL